MSPSEHNAALRAKVRELTGFLCDVQKAFPGKTPWLDEMIHGALTLLSADTSEPEDRLERLARTTDPAPPIDDDEPSAGDDHVIDNGVLRTLPFLSGKEIA